MLVDGAVSLCLGNVMRRGLKTILENGGMVGRGHALEIPPGMWEESAAHTSELGMLRVLTDFCDQDTNAHAQRVVYFAKAIACYLQLSEEEVYLAALAALLHDIGKVGIPNAILQKPGPLSEDEWRIMRLHPEIGGRMLLVAGGNFARLAPIVAAHHERWDGCGYPMGLKGEKIHIVARILAVADSYDAMISYRHYQQILSPAEARAELLRYRGSQYDPLVVKAFLGVLDERSIQTPKHVSMLSPFAPTREARPLNVAQKKMCAAASRDCQG